jgi:hypothetical protein
MTQKLLACSLVAAGIAVLALFPADVAGQAARAARPAPKASSAKPRTPWGDPDLQGLWTNTTTTPLERLREAGDKAVLSEDEREALARQVQERLDQDKPREGQVVPYNEFWYERGTLNNRTSLIVEPADGRIPPLTPEAQKRWDAQIESRRQHPADTWLDRSSYDRCISRGMPGAMLPGFYNHNYQIVQTRGYVAILVEMIHDTRIIPLDGRAHLDQSVGQWLGDPRGHWDGDTLVVETTNFNDKVFERGAAWGFGADARMTERFTRVDADHVEYQFTMTGPKTFTRPWTVSTPMTRIPGPLLEYACHEGNYALPGILGGARAEEKKGARTAQTPQSGPR